MTDLVITAGPFKFQARFETESAPKTCAIFQRLLPYEQRVIHVRWSGEAVWIPLGDTDLGMPAENQTSFPAPGHMILYPGGLSETEILLAYGGVCFASKVGQLAGNHFITIVSSLDDLPKLGKMVLWQGSAADQDCRGVNQQIASNFHLAFRVTAGHGVNGPATLLALFAIY